MLPRLPEQPAIQYIQDIINSSTIFFLSILQVLRKKGKVSEDIEFYSVMRAVRTIENSDICLLLIDATRGIEAQDLNIMSLIQKNNKGMIVLVNKWDLIEKENNTTIMFEKEIREKTAPFTDYPILFISAINKQRIHKVLELVEIGQPEQEQEDKHF